MYAVGDRVGGVRYLRAEELLLPSDLRSDLCLLRLRLLAVEALSAAA